MLADGPDFWETFPKIIGHAGNTVSNLILWSSDPWSPDPLVQSAALQTAIPFGAPSNFVADRNSILGNPTFMYYFTQAPNTTEGQQCGAYHGEFSH